MSTKNKELGGHEILSIIDEAPNHFGQLCHQFDLHGNAIEIAQCSVGLGGAGNKTVRLLLLCRRKTALESDQLFIVEAATCRDDITNVSGDVGTGSSHFANGIGCLQ